jgi:hypothetical protein
LILARINYSHRVKRPLILLEIGVDLKLHVLTERENVNTIQEVELKKVKLDKKEEKLSDLPIYLEKIEDLEDTDKSRIIDAILDEHKEIDDEWQEAHIIEELKALDNQYDGVMSEDERRMFNLCSRVTKRKVDKVDNMIMQALMKSDPKFSVSPRPGFEKQGGQDVCDKQSDFLDYKLDNLPFEVPVGQAIHNATLKRLGLVRWEHVIKREKRKREECYKGTPGQGKPFSIGVDPNTQQPITIQNDGLAEFLRNWPDAAKDYPGYIKSLSEGKEVKFVAEFTETTYDDPMPTSIDPKNFRARLDCDGYEGLKTTKLIVEYENYSYWELKRQEKRGFFFDVEDLSYEGKKEDNKKIAKFKNKTYEILRCTFYTKLKEDDEEEMKCIFWVHEDKKKMIGAIRWPYYGIDCEYVPHYISKKKRGLFGDNLADVLTDSQFAESAILNHILEAMWMRDLITPIVEKNSSIHSQFLNKSWTHGVPMTKTKDETIDFLQKYMGPTDVGGALTILQYLAQEDDAATGVSQGMSGQQTPLDPRAPAAKTMALLKMSGIDIEAYVNSVAPSFNLDGEILLQLYYQIAQDGVSYRLSPDRAKPESPFALLTRSEMIAKTNIQVQAMNFDFEKQNERQSNLALYQTFRADPIVSNNPMAVYAMAKQLIKSWSPKWSNAIDSILPDPQTFAKEQLQIASQAIARYVQKIIMEAKVTGQQPVIDPRQLLSAMQQMQVESVTPPRPEVVKAREEQNA